MRRNYRYYDFIMAAFVATMLCTNLIGIDKPITIFGLTLSGGSLFFPLTYLYGDLLTEVYGYAYSRRVIWAGFASLIFASVTSWVILAMPAAEGFTGQAALEAVFSSTPRAVAASMLAFFLGEFANSFILAKLKVYTEGRWLWSRTISSTIVGEGVDTIIFYPIAFLGRWDNMLIVKIMLGDYAFKVLWEVVATPLTYKVVNLLKRVEGENYFDRGTNFNPFSVGSGQGSPSPST